MDTGLAARDAGGAPNGGGADGYEQASPSARPTRALSFLAIGTAVLSVLAIVLEATSHFCADWQIDPMPSELYAVAYVEVVLTLLANHVFLKRASGGHLDPRWLMAAFAATSSALVTAGLATVIFLPLLPLMLFAMLIFGLGLLGFSPMLCMLTLAGQLNLLGRHLSRQPATVRRRVAWVSAGAAAVTLWGLVLQSVVIGSLIGH
jgi:hypothetical protein